MNTQLATTELYERPVGRTWRARAVGAIGPVTIVAGLVWALVQPYRITLLHPHGQDFWWLFAEPPVYVALVGVIFWLLIAPGLLDDLADEEVV